MELARDILDKVHVAVVPGTDFGVPQDLRLAFCNDRYNEGINRLREYFTTSASNGRSVTALAAVQTGTDA
jgi:aspartate/methionine/tyrosine aminotransferase